MKRFCIAVGLRPFVSTIALVGALVAAAPALAANQRSFVASIGKDTDPCTLQLPCRSFEIAIGATDPGGEVIILDTAGYGPTTITKSIKVIAPLGVYGAISVKGDTGPTTGIVINAGNGDDITLRGLDISGVPGAAPLPLIGIDIQNAGGVHIEKSSISNFTQDTSACINVNVSTTVRVYVDDTFLRACRTGIYANGTVVTSNRPSVAVDNTRIERGRGSTSYGVWLQGSTTLSLRNSMISRQDIGVLIDGLLSGGGISLQLINSELTRNSTALQFANTTANAIGEIAILGSQVLQTTNGILLTNSAVGGTLTVAIADSHVGYSSNAGITLANSAADSQSRMAIDLVRSQITNITTTAVSLSATNGSKGYFYARDADINIAATAVKTAGSGAGYNSVSLIRSKVQGCPIGIDHGFGTVRLDGNHITLVTNGFVNSGSSNIVSNGLNMVHDVPNSGGLTYVTPTVIPLQ